MPKQLQDRIAVTLVFLSDCLDSSNFCPMLEKAEDKTSDPDKDYEQ